MTKVKFPNPEKWLDIKTCEAIYKAFKEFASDFNVDSPVPSFRSRYPGVLESILGSVQFRSWAENLDISTTAGYYFVTLVKSQAFFDANKRMAVLVTDTFLRMNGYKLGINRTLLRNIAILLAKDEGKDIPRYAKDMSEIFNVTPLKP